MSLVAGLVPLSSGVITSTRTFSSPTADGYLYMSSAIYSGAWNYPSGAVVDTEVAVLGGQHINSGTYRLHRVGVFFDTSSIPDTATIDSAVLELYVTEDGSDTDFNVTIQGTGTYPHYPLESNDFYQGWYGSTSLGSADTSTITGTSTFWNVSFNEAGLARINAEGLSRFLLRSSRDISATPPSGNETVAFATREYGETWAPKLHVTYTVGTEGTGSNVYNYYFQGGYTDAGAVFNGTIHCKLYQTQNDTVEFDLVGDGVTADSISFGLEQQAQMLLWNISTTANYTRIIEFTDAISETVYLCIPTENSPFYLYSFVVNDFVGVSNGFLEASIYINGSRVVERHSIDSINNVPFYLTWGQRYDMRIVADQGTLVLGTFTALGELSPTLVIPYGSFPSELFSIAATATAQRLTETSIRINYTDPDENTYSIAIGIWHLVGNAYYSDYNATIDSFPASLTWAVADPLVDYRVIVTATRTDGYKTYNFNLPYERGTRNIFSPLDNLGSGLPVAIQYFPAIILIVAAFLGFSYWHISVGAWVGWFAAAACIWFGFLPNFGVPTVAAMGFAAFMCAIITIGEFRRNERSAII